MSLTIKTVVPGDKKYPHLLKETVNAPETLYYLGCLPVKEDILISIVGTRKATPEGRLIAKQIAKDLAAKGIIIVSGLALGIDAAAHEGALKTGKTIAVLANGLDQIYPMSHENLAKEIMKKDGAIISEYSPGTPPLPHQFLERNRIISGLSVATVVIEAPRRSGALVTAKNALDQGREVFIVAGGANNPNYQGSHILIRNGARLVTSAEDILEDLGMANLNNAKTNVEYDIPSQNIVSALKNSSEPLTIDNISEITKLEPHIVSQCLTYLILDDLVFDQNGKFSIKK